MKEKDGSGQKQAGRWREKETYLPSFKTVVEKRRETPWHAAQMGSMTISITELNKRFGSYWHVGTGRFCVACTADRRLTFCSTREIGNELLHGKCGGRKCIGHQGPYAFTLEETAAPAPKEKVSRWFRQMVSEDE